MAAAGAAGLHPGAILWAACAWIVHRRGATEALHWKVLAWLVCAMSGFAIVVHMASSDPVEQLVMGALSAVAAFTTLFVAFLPDGRDLIGNAQMTRPAEPF